MSALSLCHAMELELRSDKKGFVELIPWFNKSLLVSYM